MKGMPMNRSAVIALYVLVLTNSIGLGLLLKHSSERFTYNDYSKYLLVKECKVVIFGNYPYLNLKVLNTNKRPLNYVEWCISVYDTNDVHVLTIDDSSWRIFFPNKETNVSLDLHQSIEEYELKKNQYRLEVSASAARAAY